MGFGFLYIIDACRARALLQAAPQGGELLGRALRQDLDGSIGVVADPAGHAQHVRFSLYEPAKAYALHTSAHQEAAGVNGLFSTGHRF